MKKKIQKIPRGHHKSELLLSGRKLKIIWYDLSTAIVEDGWMWSSSWNSKEWIRGPFVQRLPRSAHYYGQIPNCFCNSSPYLPNHMDRVDASTQQEASLYPLQRQQMDGSGLHSSDWTQLLSLTGIQLPHLYQLPKDIWALGGYETASLLLTIKFLEWWIKSTISHIPKSVGISGRILLATLSVTTCYTWDEGMLRSLLLSSVFTLINVCNNKLELTSSSYHEHFMSQDKNSSLSSHLICSLALKVSVLFCKVLLIVPQKQIPRWILRGLILDKNLSLKLLSHFTILGKCSDMNHMSGGGIWPTDCFNYNLVCWY